MISSLEVGKLSEPCEHWQDSQTSFGKNYRNEITESDNYKPRLQNMSHKTKPIRVGVWSLYISTIFCA